MNRTLKRYFVTYDNMAAHDGYEWSIKGSAFEEGDWEFAHSPEEAVEMAKLRLNPEEGHRRPYRRPRLGGYRPPLRGRRR